MCACSTKHLAGSPHHHRITMMVMTAVMVKSSSALCVISNHSVLFSCPSHDVGLTPIVCVYVWVWGQHSAPVQVREQLARVSPPAA